MTQTKAIEKILKRLFKRNGGATHHVLNVKEKHLFGATDGKCLYLFPKAYTGAFEQFKPGCYLEGMLQVGSEPPDCKQIMPDVSKLFEVRPLYWSGRSVELAKTDTHPQLRLYWVCGKTIAINALYIQELEAIGELTIKGTDPLKLVHVEIGSGGEYGTALVMPMQMDGLADGPVLSDVNEDNADHQQGIEEKPVDAEPEEKPELAVVKEPEETPDETALAEKLEAGRQEVAGYDAMPPDRDMPEEEVTGLPEDVAARIMRSVMKEVNR